MKPVIKVTTSTILRAVNPSFSSISSIIKARRGPKNKLVKSEQSHSNPKVNRISGSYECGCK